MFSHLIPNLSATEWIAVIVTAGILFWRLYSMRKSLTERFDPLAKSVDIVSLKSNIVADLAPKVTEALLKGLPKAIDDDREMQLTALRNKIVDLEIELKGMEWVLVQTCFRGLGEKVRYAPVFFNVMTGAMAPAPSAMRYTTDDKKWVYQHAREKATFLATEFGAPPYSRVTGDSNSIVVLGAVYRIQK